jgi:hypothetical protein
MKKIYQLLGIICMTHLFLFNCLWAQTGPGYNNLYLDGGLENTTFLTNSATGPTTEPSSIHWTITQPTSVTITAPNVTSATTLVNGTTYSDMGFESLGRLPVIESLIRVAETPTPTGSSPQTFCGVKTLADIAVTGTLIKWYDAATGGNALSSTTTLVDGTTYYASQTVNSEESTSRLPITALVKTPVNPIFSQIAPVCEGVRFTLPTTSSNSITGTWSPLTFNGYYGFLIPNLYKTTEYTFTPNQNACANTVTMTVTIKPGPKVSITSHGGVSCGYEVITTTTTATNVQYNWYVGEQLDGVLVDIIGATNTSSVTVSADSFGGYGDYEIILDATSDATGSCVTHLDVWRSLIRPISFTGSVYPNTPLLSGTPTATVTGGYISIVNGSTILSTHSLSTGTYTIPDICNGDYKLILHKTPAGSLVPQLPDGFTAFVREGFGGGPGDGTPDGIVDVQVLQLGTLSSFRILNTNNISFALEGASPLPLNLVSFTASSANNTKVIAWSTSQEKNVSAFEVEKSLNGNEFKAFSLVSAKNGSQQSYTVIDASDLGILSYYRLKMIESDGKITYSKVAKVEGALALDEVSAIYPNPAIGATTYIDVVAQEAGEWTISELNTSGKVLSTKKVALLKGTNKITIAPAAKTQGNVLFKLSNGKTTYVRKQLY